MLSYHLCLMLALCQLCRPKLYACYMLCCFRHPNYLRRKVTITGPCQFCCNLARPNVPPTVRIRRVKQERLTDNAYPEDGSTTIIRNAGTSTGAQHLRRNLDRRIVVRLPVGEEISLLSRSFRPTLETTRPPSQWVLRG